ncbi:uncharacterized protein HMPREF1541_02084 [Cyphellophora europaea CBS 101466]|uniref:Uncharacterized protein n=1 Tax=Cyphellophora europaea (strain CBS 101466) TaxID=1220924 RepID=W2S2J9_CYPE1|nr:uncharacterized protein HMPREF1541_02084 [Cyphellophora europaea CBS 101466]ETN42926.1 hypothetical protein HMPREF1541_02084 [Cyphellophora europaea CBS 101466]
MDLSALIRAVITAFNDGVKLVARIRDDRADTDRALPEEPTRDLLDSLQLGPLLVKGQYDRDLKRFGEPFACGDSQAREQMKDVLINLQMALIISLRGVSMDDGDVDFESLQQTSDDCRTNASVCLGQLSQRLSDTAKAQAMIPEAEMLRLPAAQSSKTAQSLAYSSSRSTRSTRSSSRDPRTPPESYHDQLASMSVGSNTTTIRPQPQERKRTNSSASKRGYQQRRPMTPQSHNGSHGVPSITIPPSVHEDIRANRLRNVPSHDVLTPPDEDTLNGFRGAFSARHGSQETLVVGRGSGSNVSDAGYHSASYASRRQAAPSVTSSGSNRSASRTGYTTSHFVAVPRPERSVSRARFGGIPSDPVSLNRGNPGKDLDLSTLDDPTTSEEEDVISLRRPSSHALGFEEHEMIAPPAPESPAQSFVVALPEADIPKAPSSPVSPVSEGDHSDHESILLSPQLLPSRRYQPERFEDHQEEPDEDHAELNDATPTLGPGEFGYATVYETSRIKPVESMPRHNPPPRVRQPRQDSLSRLRESRQYTAQAAPAVRQPPVRPAEDLQELQATIRAAESRVRHYRNRPAEPQQPAPTAPRARFEHVAYLQQQPVRPPQQMTDLPLPPPLSIDHRPSSRSSGKQHKPPQGYRVFPTASPAARGAPLPPPSMAPPPPPGDRWADSTRPSTSPGHPGDLEPIASISTSNLRPTTSAPPLDALPRLPSPHGSLPSGEPGPEAEDSSSSEDEVVPAPQPARRMVKVVPLDMAMYGGMYVAPGPPKPKKVVPVAPPMPITQPLVLPTEKQLQGFCKGAYKTFLGLHSKGFTAGSRPVGYASSMPLWMCTKCNFQGPMVTYSVVGATKRLGRRKEEKIFDPKVRRSSVKGVDGQVGGVRYKWAFLAKCHVPLKKQVDWIGDLEAASRGEVGRWGCLFCCAEGQSRGWVAGGFTGVGTNDGNASIKSGSTGGSGKTTDSVPASTPVFDNLTAFMDHLDSMHRVSAGHPGAEMLGRMKCVVGREAAEGEEWEVNFVPLRDGVEAGK